ncbi:MAG: hypothetical protein JST12_14790 [Armatimonadetes bacterium]|nr:hypothetical protein [Armatimonadota bacterium]
MYIVSKAFMPLTGLLFGVGVMHVFGTMPRLYWAAFNLAAITLLLMSSTAVAVMAKAADQSELPDNS